MLKYLFVKVMWYDMLGLDENGLDGICYIRLNCVFKRRKIERLGFDGAERRNFF